MNNRFEPEISVVRRVSGDGDTQDLWTRDYMDRSGERALLVRGVPMVGEMVRTGLYTLPVVGHCPKVVLAGARGRKLLYAPEELTPAPHEDEAEVERVMEALRTAGQRWHDNPECGMSLREFEAIAAIRAMKEGER